jgi:hypothetical protein
MSVIIPRPVNIPSPPFPYEAKDARLATLETINIAE